MGQQKKKNGRCDGYDDEEYNFYCGSRDRSCEDDYCNDDYTEC